MKTKLPYVSIAITIACLTTYTAQAQLRFATGTDYFVRPMAKPMPYWSGLFVGSGLYSNGKFGHHNTIIDGYDADNTLLLSGGLWITEQAIDAASDLPGIGFLKGKNVRVGDIAPRHISGWMPSTHSGLRVGPIAFEATWGQSLWNDRNRLQQLSTWKQLLQSDSLVHDATTLALQAAFATNRGINARAEIDIKVDPLKFIFARHGGCHFKKGGWQIDLVTELIPWGRAWDGGAFLLLPDDKTDLIESAGRKIGDEIPDLIPGRYEIAEEIVRQIIPTLPVPLSPWDPYKKYGAEATGNIQYTWSGKHTDKTVGIGGYLMYREYVATAQGAPNYSDLSYGLQVTLDITLAHDQCDLDCIQQLPTNVSTVEYKALALEVCGCHDVNRPEPQLQNEVQIDKVQKETGEKTSKKKATKHNKKRKRK